MSKEICYGESEKQKLDLFLLDKKAPMYIYFHGGGLSGGDKAHYAYMGEFFNAHGISFASVNYRLYPNAKFPEFIEDCAEAVKHVYREYGDKIEYLTLGGSSAGGYITMMLYFDKHYLAELPEELLRGYLFDAGQPTTHFNLLEQERKIDSRRILIDEAAPLWYLDKPFSGYVPEIVITTAEHDMVNRREQNVMLYTAMLHFGYDENKLKFICYEGEKHCSYLKKEQYLSDVLGLIVRSK